MLTEIDRLTAIREARPEESLFAEKEWLISPEPFALEEKLRADLERLGHQLFVFQRACNQLYQQSVKGKQPEWVARYLDIGKPPALVEYSRQKVCRDALPRVIRPDLILTDEGWTIAETDSVPGGIGLTGWLNQTYSGLGFEVIGAADGMLDGFVTVLPQGGDILVSLESATYRPEMEWLVRQLNARFPERSWNVEAAENYHPQPGRDVYRFFELFDLPNLPGISALMEEQYVPAPAYVLLPPLPSRETLDSAQLTAHCHACTLAFDFATLIIRSGAFHGRSWSPSLGPPSVGLGWRAPLEQRDGPSFRCSWLSFVSPCSIALSCLPGVAVSSATRQYSRSVGCGGYLL